jgi:hypothetical protein
MKLHRRKILHLAAGAAALHVYAVASYQDVAAQSAQTGMREVPARVLPVPDTVSPQMRALIARPSLRRTGTILSRKPLPIGKRELMTQRAM